jgi:hypothetical protein
MTQRNDEKYPALSDIIKKYELSFGKENIITGNCSEKVYMFDTHPFYSKLGDYSDVDMGEGK